MLKRWDYKTVKHGEFRKFYFKWQCNSNDQGITQPFESKDTKVEENHSWPPAGHLGGRNPGERLLIIAPDYSTQAADSQVLSEKLLKSHICQQRPFFPSVSRVLGNASFSQNLTQNPARKEILQGLT